MNPPRFVDEETSLDRGTTCTNTVGHFSHVIFDEGAFWILDLLAGAIGFFFLAVKMCVYQSAAPWMEQNTTQTGQCSDSEANNGALLQVLLWKHPRCLLRNSRQSC